LITGDSGEDTVVKNGMIIEFKSDDENCAKQFTGQ